MRFFFHIVLTAFLAMLVPLTLHCQKPLGMFDGHQDVGSVKKKGRAFYYKKNGQYDISASGANIWGTRDEFHFVWKKLKGDFILQARARFKWTGADPHRKIGWMIRTSLQPDAASVNATVHGDGLASLQFRKKDGTEMEERKSSISAPDMIQLERRGNLFIMSVARLGDPYTTTEIKDIELGQEVYAGLFLSAHNADAVEHAYFDNVRMVVPAREGLVQYREYLGSHMEVFELALAKRRIVYSSPESLQAPNWTRDGKSLIYNSKGLIYRLKLNKKKPGLINTGEVKSNNNDHVISFDGKMLGLSSTSPDGKYNSVVYTVPIQGGTPKQITPTGPSYLHGWSPDGKYLTYTARRQDDFDIYKIPSGGGEEIRLTTTPGLDDGSEFSPDGKYIYFNSVRSGTMQIWRMDADGSNPVQVTNDEFNNWFPHISPDGKWMVFLSFMKDVKPDEHPFYKQVYLRLMPVERGIPKVVVYLYGGQGTINTPSWSPDSRRFAFVSNSDVLR